MSFTSNTWLDITTLYVDVGDVCPRTQISVHSICLLCPGISREDGAEDSLSVAGCYLAERLHDECLPHTPHRKSIRLIRTIPADTRVAIKPMISPLLRGARLYLISYSEMEHLSPEEPTCWHSLVEATSKGVRRWTGAWVPACRTSAPARSSALPRHPGRKI